jgi:predicted Rossmann-fold nucleotide-binding protein
VGLNISLPHEQYPNPYLTPSLCFQFRYFAIRKLHFLLRARALVVFPGGFGTMDELFETLTLIQTRKVKPVPVVLVGRNTGGAPSTRISSWRKASSTPRTVISSGTPRRRRKSGTTLSAGTSGAGRSLIG